MASRNGLLVVPANNTTMQPEMDALCPDLAPFTVARVPRPARTLVASDLPAYADSTLGAVAPMVADGHRLVVYGCTAAGFLGGPEGNRRMTEALAQRTGAAVVSTSDAMIQVLRYEGVTEVAVGVEAEAVAGRIDRHGAGSRGPSRRRRRAWSA